MTIDDPTDEQVERLADIADEGLATMTSEVLGRQVVRPDDAGFPGQCIVRALREHSPEKELREVLIDEELSEPQEARASKAPHKEET
jgi:hypothetical protein